MAGISFSHPLVQPPLELRLPPTEVQWSYNLNTAKTVTYAGEVVQVLSVSFDKLVITGKFGKEGAHGADTRGVGIKRRHSENWNTNLKYGVGLVQMMAWFREYFSIASQGVDSAENYDERPVVVKYQGGIKDIAVDYGKSEHMWKVYPVSFPSYRRSNENFAPEWQIECEVAEADDAIAYQEKDAAIERLKRSARWEPMNKYSDPLARYLPNSYNTATNAQKNALLNQAYINMRKDAANVADYFNDIIPSLSAESFRELLLTGASAPVIAQGGTTQKKPKANDRIGGR